MEGILIGFALIGVFFFLKTVFASRPESAPGPLRRIIEHDAKADASCVRMVEHGVSYLLRGNQRAPAAEIIETMREALRNNRITNPTAFGLLTKATVERLRRAPIEDIDHGEISFLFDDGD